MDSVAHKALFIACALYEQLASARLSFSYLSELLRVRGKMRGEKKREFLFLNRPFTTKRNSFTSTSFS